MPIHRLLENEPFGPSEISTMTSAFKDVLHIIGVIDRGNPVAEAAAKIPGGRPSRGRDSRRCNGNRDEC